VRGKATLFQRKPGSFLVFTGILKFEMRRRRLTWKRGVRLDEEGKV